MRAVLQANQNDTRYCIKYKFYLGSSMDYEFQFQCWDIYYPAYNTSAAKYKFRFNTIKELK